MITYKRILVTPEMAKEILANRNANNYRKLKPSAAKLYEKDMREGRWIENGDTIRFDTNGDLIDGQHKLTAIAESGIPQYYIIVENLDPKCAQTIDIGVRRSVEDYLRKQSKMYNTGAAAIVRSVNTLKKHSKFFGQASYNSDYSNTEMVKDYLENQALYNESTEFGNEINKLSRGVLKRNNVGAIYYYLTYICGVNKIYVKEFFYKLAQYTTVGSSIYTKTYELLSDKDKLGRGSANVTKAYIKCWNCMRHGCTKQLRDYSEWFEIPNDKNIPVVSETFEEVPMV